MIHLTSRPAFHDSSVYLNELLNEVFLLALYYLKLCCACNTVGGNGKEKRRDDEPAATNQFEQPSSEGRNRKWKKKIHLKKK